MLDYDNSPNNFGKKIGDDFKEGKVTIPILMAYNKSNKIEKIFWKKVIEDMNQSNGDFKKCLDIIDKYKCLEDAKNIAESYALKAREILNSFPKNNFNYALQKICNFVFNRKN